MIRSVSFHLASPMGVDEDEFDELRSLSLVSPPLVKKSPEWQDHRRKIGHAVAAERGSISEFARRIGIQTQTACKWLSNHDEPLYRRLREDALIHNILPPEKRLDRLVKYKAGRAEGLSHTKASKECGISQNRMRIWLQLWASDGIDQAIEDETFAAEASNGTAAEASTWEDL